MDSIHCHAYKRIVIGFSMSLLAGSFFSPSLRAADECDPLPSCGGVPECMTADDCKLKEWPLRCPEQDGWWQCCNGIGMNERCCVPHCPEFHDAEADAETGSHTSGNDSGGCSAMEGSLPGWILGLAALAFLEASTHLRSKSHQARRASGKRREGSS